MSRGQGLEAITHTAGRGVPGDHGTAIATPQFEAAIFSFRDGRAAAV